MLENPAATAAPDLPAIDGPASTVPSRDEFLATLENEKARRLIADLRDVGYYDWARLFPRTEGFGAAGDIKRRVKWLLGVEPRLDTLLYPGERIEFITKGTLSSFAEQYFMGLWSLLINRTLFLFTNYRVILLNADGKARPRTMMWQISYGRLARFKTGWVSSATRFKLSGGKTLTFSNVPSRDRKLLKAYVASRVEGTRAIGFQFPSHADRDNLCPSCASPVAPGQRACADCCETFIPARRPAIMSFFLPGLGHLYLGHRAMGLVEMAGFAVLILIFAMAIATGRPGDLAIWSAVILVANSIDAAITYSVARKGLIPAANAWRG